MAIESSVNSLPATTTPECGWQEFFACATMTLPGAGRLELAKSDKNRNPFETLTINPIVETHINILEKIASTLDSEEVFKRIVEAAVQFSGADEGSLLLPDAETNELYMRASKGFGEEIASSFRQSVNDDNIAGRVMKTGRPVLIGPESGLGEQVKVKTGYLARSILNLPIIRNEQVLGVLAVYNSGSRRTFTGNHLLLLTPLAKYAAIAIENARRYEETHQLLGDAYTLFDIAGLFTETRDFNELLQLIGDQALERLEATDRVVIHLLDEKTGRLERKLRIPPAEERAEKPRGFFVGEGIAGQVLKEDKPINVANVGAEPSFVARGITAGSLFVAPISRHDTCIGTISSASPQINAFTQRDERFLTSLANLAAFAIENARLFEAEEARATQLSVVAQLAEKLTSILDLDELLQQTVTLIHETFGFEDVSIRLFDAKADGFAFKVAAGLNADMFELEHVQKLGEGMVGWVGQTGETALSNDVSQDSRYKLSLSGTKSELDVPLKYRGRLIGVLDVQSQSLNAFGEHDVLAIEALADQVAVAIVNARLYARQLQLNEENQERLETVERRNRELSSLRDILGALQSTLSLSEVLARVANGVVKGLNYRAVMLATIDEASQSLTVQEFAVESDPVLVKLLTHERQLIEQNRQALFGKTVSLLDHKVNMGIRVSLDGQARVTHNLYDIARPVAPESMCRKLQDMFLLKTFVVLPIRLESRLFGVLYAATHKEEILPADLEALQAFASQAALAIQNARQYEHVHSRLRRRVRELQSLQNIERLISSTPDLDLTLKNILDVGLKLVDANFGTIVLSDKTTGELVPRVSHPEGSVVADNYKPGLAGWVAQEKQTRREADLPATRWADSYRNLDIHSELAAPILAGGELMGVITMGSATPDAFTEEDESLLNILTTQTAVAIQTARYYQELEKTRLRTLEAERIAAMSDIATNMVHSINNSDGAIRVLVQQLRSKLDRGTLSNELLSKRLDDIQKSAEKTLKMARNIRNPFQDQPTEPIAVDECIRSVLNTFEPFAPTIDLILDLENGRLSVLGTQHLGEVFRNLIKNAIEAMDNDGSLLITSRRLKETVEISISDSGPGIPAQLTETDIFKLGVTDKEGGLGYGLWWCQIYLNRVGGSIRLDRTVPAGCRFVVELSIAQPVVTPTSSSGSA
jgi:GAF domain-containing protein